MTANDPDRTVHAKTRSGLEFVRYDRSGKWYIETMSTRHHASVDEAAREAVSLGAFVHFGRPGGAVFDRKVRAFRGST